MRKTKDKIRAHCPRCRHQQIFTRATINHPLHLLLSLMTAGLWIISWIAICLGRFMRPWRCEHCGWHTPVFEPRPTPSTPFKSSPSVRTTLIGAHPSRPRP